MPSSLGVAAALLASQLVHGLASSPSPADRPPMMAGFSEFTSGEGFLAVPVGTVQRPARQAKSKDKRAGQAYESQLENKDFFYATDGECRRLPMTIVLRGQAALTTSKPCLPTGGLGLDIRIQSASERRLSASRFSSTRARASSG